MKDKGGAKQKYPSSSGTCFVCGPVLPATFLSVLEQYGGIPRVCVRKKQYAREKNLRNLYWNRRLGPAQRAVGLSAVFFLWAVLPSVPTLAFFVQLTTPAHGMCPNLFQFTMTPCTYKQ